MAMIQILLATFNSASFIGAQIDSLMEQTCSDFEIVVSDGGSKDNTLGIIADYQRRFPGKIRLLETSPASACENFSRLLAAADAELLMFCDHDDVWKKEKIAASLQAYKKLEQEYGTDCPILVFTDSEIVDVHLNTRFSSMMRSQRLNRTRFTPGRTMIQNYASGNTMLFNRALQKIALPVGNNAIMHDHWVALAAAFFGKVCYVDTPLILYRQHGDNVIGSFCYNLRSCLKKFRSERSSLHNKLYRNIEQGQEFLALHREILSPEQQRFFDSLMRFKQMGKIEKWRFMQRNDIQKEGLLYKIGTFFFI